MTDLSRAVWKFWVIQSMQFLEKTAEVDWTLSLDGAVSLISQERDDLNQFKLFWFHRKYLKSFVIIPIPIFNDSFIVRPIGRILKIAGYEQTFKFFRRRDF